MERPIAARSARRHKKHRRAAAAARAGGEIARAMSPRARAMLQVAVLLAVVIGLVLLFPRAYAFVEMAARELRYFWWLVLLVALAIWLIWGIGRKPKL